jgi:hypothetical protein
MSASKTDMGEKYDIPLSATATVLLCVTDSVRAGGVMLADTTDPAS